MYIYVVLKTSPCGHRGVRRCRTATKSTQTQILGLLNIGSHCGQEDISKCYIHLIQKKLDDIELYEFVQKTCTYV